MLAALRAPDLPLPGLTARGYGEADPVADNATAEGRAKNRRIAFTPVAGEPAAEPAAADAARPTTPTDADCVARIDAVLADKSIQFEAGSATITPESGATVTRHRRRAARLPRRGAGDRRPHRLAGIGVRATCG